MTTLNLAAVADAVIAFKKGVTLQLLRALRDNTIAIAEADATVPNALRSTVILGTITTTTGTTQTLSGLDLTPYRFLRVTFDKVKVGATASLQINGVAFAGVTGPGGDGYVGTLEVDLSLGVGSCALGNITTTPGSNTAAGSSVFFSSLLINPTSISVSVLGAAFAGGLVKFYGEK